MPRGLRSVRVREAGWAEEPAPASLRISSYPVSAGTAASQKSSLRPVEPFTSSSERTTSSDGSLGVPPWSTSSSTRIWPGFLAIALPFSPQNPVAGGQDEDGQRAVAVVRYPQILLNHQGEGPQGPTILQIREHVGLGAVLQEVDETVRAVRDRLDLNVQDDCHFHSQSGAAEVLVDELELVVDRLPKRGVQRRPPQRAWLLLQQLQPGSPRTEACVSTASHLPESVNMAAQPGPAESRRRADRSQRVRSPPR
jgi:hypothetical protein